MLTSLWKSGCYNWTAEACATTWQDWVAVLFVVAFLFCSKMLANINNSSNELPECQCWKSTLKSTPYYWTDNWVSYCIASAFDDPLPPGDEVTGSCGVIEPEPGHRQTDRRLLCHALLHVRRRVAGRLDVIWHFLHQRHGVVARRGTGRGQLEWDVGCTTTTK